MQSIANDLSWGFPKKVAFRFFFILLILLIFLNNNGAFLYVAQLSFYPTQLLHQFIPWFSNHVLKYNYDFSIFTNGSGDTSYNYVLLLFIVLLAGFGCLIWSIFDSKRNNYNKLYYWLIVLVRFYVAFTLMMYGSIKVIQLQFPQPYLSRLLQPFGEASPMGLVWTFLGFSKGYNIFMGIVEILSVFLLFRKTVVIGALFALAASVNVMATNYFFDVPVKILSTTLVVMCVFILAPYLVTIIRFFLFQELQQLKLIQVPVFKKKWQLITIRSFKYLCIVWTIAILVSNVLTQQYTYGTRAPKPYMYGIYNVESMKLKGKILAPLTTDSTRWKQMVINWTNYATVKLMNDSLLTFNTKFDTVKKEVVFNSQNLENAQYKLKFNFLGKDHLKFYGIKNGDSISILFKRKDLKDFKLINRGFHWVSEYPYNR